MGRDAQASRPPLVYLLAGVVGALYSWAVVLATFRHPGVIGLNYNAPGSDYMVFHTAVSLALQGDLATLYDPDRFTQLLNSLFHGYLSGDLEFRPWIYPPLFLLLLMPFGRWVNFNRSWSRTRSPGAETALPGLTVPISSSSETAEILRGCGLPVQIIGSPMIAPA